jgi:hypothetical protein
MQRRGWLEADRYVRPSSKVCSNRATSIRRTNYPLCESGLSNAWWQYESRFLTSQSRVGLDHVSRFVALECEARLFCPADQTFISVSINCTPCWTLKQMNMARRHRDSRGAPSGCIIFERQRLRRRVMATLRRAHKPDLREARCEPWDQDSKDLTDDWAPLDASGTAYAVSGV